MANGRHHDFDRQMTLNCKNNHTNDIRVFKLGKNEVLHKILGLLCQKFNMAAAILDLWKYTY